ncbi:hypothetical protein [Lactiplantibacillus pentosus]
MIKFRAWESTENMCRFESLDDKANERFKTANEVYRHKATGLLTNLYQKLKVRNTKRGYGDLNFDLAQFKDWSANEPRFLRLFRIWVFDDYSKDFKPSVDRINPHLGYSFKNMQWLTWKENYIKGINEGSSKKKKPIIMTKEGIVIGRFKSIQDAQYFLNLSSNGDISRALLNSNRTVNEYGFKYDNPELLEEDK